MKPIPKDKKALIKFIKARYPIGSLVYDITRSQPYKIKKQSVFEVYEWEYEIGPEDEGDVYLDFLVRDTGKLSEFYSIDSYPRKWCYEK
jgi:hypothetical protein